MASTLLARVTQANERLQSRLKNERMEKASTTRRFLGSAAAAAGAATPGVMRGMFGDPTTGDIKVRDVEVDGAFSTVALVVGLGGWLDEASDYAAIYGGAGVGAVLGREIEQSLLAQRRSQAR
jgi:hypothetical protein